MTLFENDAIIIREAEESEKEQLSAMEDYAGIAGKDDRIYAVADKEGTLIGALCQRRYSEWQMEGIVCYTLPEHRRKGAASGAVRAFTRWFYDNTAENMLVAVVDLENVPAVRTLERAGYEYIRTTTLCSGENEEPAVFHLFVCSRAVADAGAPPRGCCCGCGGHAGD